MTVASNQNRKEYAGDGVTSSFATSPVVFFDSTDLNCYVVTDATGGVANLTEDTHYSVSGGGTSPATGTVDLSGGSAPYGAPASGETLIIVRDINILQQVDYVNNEINDAEVQEAALDRLTLISQQLETLVNRRVGIADTDSMNSLNLPIVTERASKFLAFDANGEIIVSNPAVGDIPTSVVTDFVTLRSGTPVNDALVYVACHTNMGDGGGGWFRGVTGAPASTYSDDNGLTLIPSGGDGSSAWLREYAIVNAKYFGFAEAGSAADNKTALQAAITSLGSTGGRVFVPEGNYNINAGITSPYNNIEIFGESHAFYELQTSTGTNLNFQNAGIGFDFTFGGASGTYRSVLRGLNIYGGTNLTTGIKSGRSILIQDCSVSKCTGSGIWLDDWTVATEIRSTNSSYNAAAGLLVSGTALTNRITTVGLEDCSFYRNEYGINMTQCQGFHATNCRMESNYGQAIVINAAKNAPGSEAYATVNNVVFDGCHLEANALGPTGTDVNYAPAISLVKVAGAAAPSRVTFRQCIITEQTKFKCTATNAKWLTFDNCWIYAPWTGAITASQITLGSDAKFTKFIDTLPVYDPTHTVVDDVYLQLNDSGSGTQIINSTTTGKSFDTTFEALAGIKFPAPANPSSDPNTLDDYAEGTWTPTPTAGTGTFTTVSASGSYTKIGREVSFALDITITTNGTAATEVVCALPPLGNAASPHTFSGTGRETGVTGNQLWWYITGGAATIKIYNLDLTYPGADSYVLRVSGTYRI